MRYVSVFIFCLLLSCKNDQKKENPIATIDVLETTNDDLVIVDFDGLKPYLNKKDDKTYIVNFWATWCGPCVKELPYFEQIGEAYKNKYVEVILVSLDFPRKYETKLKPYIKENKLKSKVIAFDDLDMNTWIPAINKNWSGAIPATIIYNSNERKFYERSFTYSELETELKQFIK
ncbi:TlpA disulfide reductase family protein [Ichthyenterobacterium sp. W332]|uniref:TlpA disulfide reductase family protein n=1 Tax=Microcosmobacter mediterraneus TaxID=3075607 RepID=A0ABU2YN65_9FLAO|nr:TlpA disulfide reductase family protein [Ichthyenterobacterium sp. W332]MDT0559611.1 TlpA disulfide reductase family protein [Ichthyenterobacterium sp. W332]